MVDDLYDYPIGGVDDMVHRTIHHWRDMIDMFENKSNKTKSNNLNQSQSHYESKEQSLLLLEKFKHVILEQLEPKMKQTENGVHFYTKNSFKSLDRKFNEGIDSYFYKGYSLSKYKDSIIYSSPGYGIEGKPNTGKITFHNEKYHLIGKDLSAKVGYRSVFLDFNMDGNIDLVVSGPEYGSTHQNYYPKGAVYIFFGNGTMRFKDTPDIKIFGDFGNKDQFSNVGRALEVGDINGDGFDDLMIGSPVESNGRGSVTVYYARKNFKKEYQNVKDSDHVLVGSSFSYFGFKILFLKKENPLLLIGAPKMSLGGIDSRGCLYAYEFKENKFNPKFTIIGEKKFDQTGMNFAVGNPIGKEKEVLAISSPTKEILNPNPTL